MVYSLYAEQIFSASSTKETALARATVQKVVDASNMVYYSGAGSTARVFVEIPDTTDLVQSDIQGRSVSLRLKGGGDVVATSDVNIFGAWKYSTGKYFFFLVYDGNVVRLDYRPFELNRESIFVSGVQGSTRSAEFTIKNSSTENQECWVSIDFSHSLAVLVPSSGYDNFVLTPNESKKIDLNFVLSKDSSGNYAGKIDITCELDDVNSTKTLFVAVESLLKVDYVLLYSKNVYLEINNDQKRKQDYLVCNLTSSLVHIDSFDMGGVDNNIPLAWYSATFPPAGITDLNQTSCKSFEVEFDVPAAAIETTYVGHPTVHYPDSNYYSATLTIKVK
ncbi:MAG: hypothetical protein AABW59_01610 [archaeon]